MKRPLCLFAICILIVGMLSSCSQAKQDEFPEWQNIGVYPISPEDEEWKNMSYAELLEALALPEELVDSLSTEDLAEWALAYPYLGDIFLYDSVKAYLDSLSRKSYLFSALFAREDVNEVLLDKFEELQVDYSMLADDNAEGVDTFTESGYFKELFLQCYFRTVRTDLPEEEKRRLKEILKEKEDAKIGIYEDYTIKILTSEEIFVDYGEQED